MKNCWKGCFRRSKLQNFLCLLTMVDDRNFRHIPTDHPEFGTTAEKWNYLITMTDRIQNVISGAVIHLWLVFLHPFYAEIFKLCKLEFGIACCFNILIGIWHITSSGTFSLCFAQQSNENLRDQPWGCTYFGEELTFVAADFLQKYPWC